MSESTPERPVLRIVKGSADDTEIAAVTLALTAAARARAAAAAADESEADGPVSAWADRAAALRQPAHTPALRPGPHAWRTSTLPR